jgi:hypothetical protein
MGYSFLNEAPINFGSIGEQRIRSSHVISIRCVLAGKCEVGVLIVYAQKMWISC